MKTTQKKAIEAYNTLIGIGNKASGDPAFTLFNLKLELRNIFEFQTEEENKLIRKYDAKVTPDGRIIIEDKQKNEEFGREYMQLGELECEINEVEVPRSGVPGITLNEIEALYGFVHFV